jgi:hypothetical protein
MSSRDAGMSGDFVLLDILEVDDSIPGTGQFFRVLWLKKNIF